MYDKKEKEKREREFGGNTNLGLTPLPPLACRPGVSYGSELIDNPCTRQRCDVMPRHIAPTNGRPEYL